MNFWVTLSVVSFTYVGVALGKWPRLRVNRATLTLIGAGLLIALHQIDFNRINQFLDLNTIILLFSMMVINAYLELSGFFQLAGSRLLRLAHSPRTFLAVEILLAGLLSALFLNDTICLMLTPLVLNICRSAKRNPIPYLIALATAANIGSTATLTGNPQNMIIGVASGISYLEFVKMLGPVALLGLIGVWGTLVLLYHKEFSAGPFQAAETTQPQIYRPLFIKSMLVILALLIAFLAGIPTAEAALLAACALLLTRRISPEKVFARVDWGLLVFFSALFIVTGSLDANGVSQKLFSLVQLNRNTNVLGLSAATVVLSNLISNVPAVMLLRPVVAALSNPTAGWLTLAAASTLAGNLTLLGSVANLIVAESARHQNVELTFWEYTRAGLIITFISLVIGIGWIMLFVWR